MLICFDLLWIKVEIRHPLFTPYFPLFYPILFWGRSRNQTSIFTLLTSYHMLPDFILWLLSVQQHYIWFGVIKNAFLSNFIPIIKTCDTLLEINFIVQMYLILIKQLTFLSRKIIGLNESLSIFYMLSKFYSSLTHVYKISYIFRDKYFKILYSIELCG